MPLSYYCFQWRQNLCPVTVSVSDWRLNVSAQKQQDHPAIQWWLVQHPLFVSAQDEEHRNTVFDADPFCLVGTIQRGRFQDTAQGSASFPSLHTDDSWGHIGCCLFCFLRAYRNGLAAIVGRCSGTSTPVARCFPCPILCIVLIFRAHCNFVESLTRA